MLSETGKGSGERGRDNIPATVKRRGGRRNTSERIFQVVRCVCARLHKTSRGTESRSTQRLQMLASETTAAWRSQFCWVVQAVAGLVNI